MIEQVLISVIISCLGLLGLCHLVGYILSRPKREPRIKIQKVIKRVDPPVKPVHPIVGDLDDLFLPEAEKIVENTLPDLDKDFPWEVQKLI